MKWWVVLWLLFQVASALQAAPGYADVPAPEELSVATDLHEATQPLHCCADGPLSESFSSQISSRKLLTPFLNRSVFRGIREFNDARDSVKKSLDDSIRQAERETEEQRRTAASKAVEAQRKEP